MSDFSGLGQIASKEVENNYNMDGKKTTKSEISQSAKDKIVYDILSSDQGLAGLSQGENLVGGNSSSTKSLMSQDLAAKIAGELGKYEVQTTEETDQEKRSLAFRQTSKMGKATVICTELKRRNMIPEELYLLAGPPTNQVDYYTWRGYYFWASPLAKVMHKHEWLCKLFTPIVIARYKQILYIENSFLGALAVYVGQPICHVLGRILYTLAQIKFSVFNALRISA